MSKKIKIAILADAGSTHTVKWVNALSAKGLDVYLISLRKPFAGTISENVEINILENKSQTKSSLLKLGYFKRLKAIKRLVNQISPDILHAYYASSYGALGRHCNHPNFFISVWGSDVFEFPNKSPLHKYLLKRNLSAAKHLFSTSMILKEETQKYTKKTITVIPFGIDVSTFIPQNKMNSEELVFGTVKILSNIYGIDIMIKSFAKFCENYNGITKLLLVGNGPDMDFYKSLVVELGIDDKVEFYGYVDPDYVPELIQRMDVFLVLSRRESFGVAALEGAACGLPVIASSTGGLPEVVLNNKTGCLVPVEDVEKTVEKMKVMVDPRIRKSMGKAGRDFVSENYNWKKNVDQMVETYKKILS